MSDMKCAAARDRTEEGRDRMRMYSSPRFAVSSLVSNPVQPLK